MQRLMRDESGAVLVYVAFLLVVLIGMGAIAVDAGALYQEHRELQNGADAAALAVAEDCASGDTITACGGIYGNWDTTAELYADSNAEDDTSEVEVTVDWAAQRVTADAITMQGTNPPGQLTVWFARVFGIQTGNGQASAEVIWGHPQMGSLNTLPITISECEYDAAVAEQGGLIADPPPTGIEERVLLFHNSAAGGGGGGTADAGDNMTFASTFTAAAGGGGKGGGNGGGRPSEEPSPTPSPTSSPSPSPSPSPDPGPGNGGGGNGGGGNGGGNGGGGNEGDCPTGPAGHDATLDGDLPGGFGWLRNTGECEAAVTGNTAEEDPGNDVPMECSAQILEDKLLNKIVYLPIFEAVNDLGGANGGYTLAGYAGFYVTGYNFPGHPDYSQPDDVDCDSSQVTAGPSNTCLRGWFTTGVVAEGAISTGGTDYGVTIIALDK